MKISNIASDVKPSMTVGISALVNELKSQGKEIVNLSIGEPDYYTPEVIKEAGIRAINNNLTKYTAAPGFLNLRKAICDKLLNENNVKYDVDNIVVTSGAKMAITISMITTVCRGDEVIIPSPYWLSYPKIVKVVGAKPVMVKTKKENSFKITVDELKDAITDKTSMVIINNPSNPTGSVYTESELRSICEFLTERNITILADEIYERFTYDQEFTSIASLSEEIKENTILINGHSKSYSMTGWRLGYLAAPKKVAAKVVAMQSHVVSHPSTISMEAARIALIHGHKDVEIMKNKYNDRRKILVKKAKEYGLEMIEPKGAFYGFFDISRLRKNIKADSLSIYVCEKLLEEKSLAITPGIVFGNDNFVRLSYAARTAEILEGIKRFGEFMNENS